MGNYTYYVNETVKSCETGDIIIIIKTITSPMLKEVKIGRYNAHISRQGQPHQTSSRSEMVGHKCLDTLFSIVKISGNAEGVNRLDIRK